MALATSIEPTIPDALIGQRLDDPKVQEIFKSWGSPSIYDKNTTKIYKFIDDGISLVVNNRGVIEGVIFYSLSAYKFKQYQGTLPHGLTFNDTKEDVQSKLGKPNEETATIDKHVVTIYKNYDMAISYVSRDRSDANPKIFVIYIRKDY